MATTFYNAQNLVNIGSVGIGTTNPVALLSVQGTATAGRTDMAGDSIEIGAGRTSDGLTNIDFHTAEGTYSDYSFRILRNSGANGTASFFHRGTGDFNYTTVEAAAHVWYATNTERMRLTAAGSLGIGNVSPSYPLDVTGAIRATADITAYSDRRVKANLEKITGALDKVAVINGYTFTRSDSDSTERHAGVIAQEVQEVLPEVVSTDNNGCLSVAYGNMVALLIEALKEERSKRESLEARISALELRP